MKIYMPGKQSLDIKGLPTPWLAFFSKRRNRIYYFNEKTGESCWNIPDECKLTCVNPVKVDDVRDSLSKGEFDVTEPMEVDEGSGIQSDITYTASRLGEPMETDITSAESSRSMAIMKSFNNKSFHSKCSTIKDVLLVFDTSTLLEDIKLFEWCLDKEQFTVLIPYTVLMELDALKNSNSLDSRARTRRANTILHKMVGCRHQNLFLESSHEASDRLEGFLCTGNDDQILKCALIASDNLPKGVEVIFATNDKNLSLKAIAHNLEVVDDQELRQLFNNDFISKETQSSKRILPVKQSKNDGRNRSSEDKSIAEAEALGARTGFAANKARH